MDKTLRIGLSASPFKGAARSALAAAITLGAMLTVQGADAAPTPPAAPIGSQSSGAGAGKVTFNPFSITKKTDRASPQFFQNAPADASGRR